MVNLSTSTLFSSTNALRTAYAHFLTNTYLPSTGSSRPSVFPQPPIVRSKARPQRSLSQKFNAPDGKSKRSNETRKPTLDPLVPALLNATTTSNSVPLRVNTPAGHVVSCPPSPPKTT